MVNRFYLKTSNIGIVTILPAAMCVCAYTYTRTKSIGARALLSSYRRAPTVRRMTPCWTFRESHRSDKYITPSTNTSLALYRAMHRVISSTKSSHLSSSYPTWRVSKEGIIWEKLYLLMTARSTGSEWKKYIRMNS